jgi:hypothetical protein
MYDIAIFLKEFKGRFPNGTTAVMVAAGCSRPIASIV